MLKWTMRKENDGQSIYRNLYVNGICVAQVTKHASYAHYTLSRIPVNLPPEGTGVTVTTCLNWTTAKRLAEAPYR